MNIRNRIEQLSNHHKLKKNRFEIVIIHPDETSIEAEERTKREVNYNGESEWIAYKITLLSNDVNFYKMKYIDSLKSYKAINKTKSMIQILDEHRETITDPDELRKWDSLPGDII
jgi:hypothetical protein